MGNETKRIKTITSLDDFFQGDIVPVKNSPEYMFEGYFKMKNYLGELDSLRFYFSPDKKEIIQVDAFKRFIGVDGNQLVLPFGYFERNSSTEYMQKNRQRIESDLYKAGLLNK